MNYLKKTKMYELLKSVVKEDLVKMKYASYKFYRGSEWLKCGTDDEEFTFYNMYRQGYFVSIDVYKYDDTESELIEIDRITFRLTDGKLIKEYQRSEI